MDARAVQNGAIRQRKRSVLLALSWYDHRVHQGVARFASERGWHLDTRMAYSNEPAWGWRGDGVICKIGCSTHDERLEAFVRSLGLPTVDLSVYGPNAGLPSLEFDPDAIGRLAADHFIERGFRHFAWYPGLTSRPIDLRRQGFARALAASDHTLTILEPVDASAASDSWRTAERELGRQLRELPQPLGVLTFNDEWGVQILQACERVGLHVPEQVAVLGVDNQELVCENRAVPLSSVAIDLEAWGERAAEMLDGLMGQPDAIEAKMNLIAPYGIVCRQSTDVIAVEHRGVANAVRHIAEHFREPMTVADVVAASQLSASGLKLAFRRHLRRTIQEEIARLRLKSVRELLSTTDWTLDRVAEASGLSGPRSLHRLISRHEGCSPQAYRLKARG